MTEKEKMLSRQLYDPADPQLVQERLVCKEQCYQFNALRPGQTDQQQFLLARLFGRLGARACVMASFWCDYGYNISVGSGFFANHNCVILDPAPVVFGDNVLIGPACGFYTAVHPLDAEVRSRGLEYAYPIHIGHDIWFGGGVTVLPGVTIGSGSVIGAGSVVSRSLPEGVLAVGNPCRVLRQVTANDVFRR